MKKDVIYIDPDDEITAITGKLVASASAVVALVLPKRCQTLQSSVNLKILNRTASQANKNLVLVTSEPAILQIAGLTGMYVSKTLQSKPYLPESMATDTTAEGIEEIVEDQSEEVASPEPEDVIEASEDPKPVKAVSAKPKKDKTPKKDKKLKVPNFDTFRNKLFWIVGGILAVVGIALLMFVVLPKATIAITSATQPVSITTDITAIKSGTTNNIDDQTFALKTNTIDKSDSKTASATGERNDGNKASGTINIYNCDYSDGFTIPAGSVFTTGFSNGTASFVSTEAVSVPKFSGSSSNCKISTPYSGAGKATASVTATQPGASYNLSSSRTYSVAGISDTAKVSAIGSAMGGGQDKITKIVTQDDCDKAKTDVQNSLSGGDYQKQLTTEFEKEGITASTDTFSAKTVSITCIPAVGTAATEVTAKAAMQYTMSGVDSKALNELITKLALAKTGAGQTVADTGLSSGKLDVKQTKPNGDIFFTVNTTAKVGLKQDPVAIADSVKGKNARQTSDIIKSINGVKDVKVDYSPFWVSKTPTNTKKIKIVFVNETANQ